MQVYYAECTELSFQLLNNNNYLLNIFLLTLNFRIMFITLSEPHIHNFKPEHVLMHVLSKHL